jgi:protein tyrosine/serine phosphatase
MRRAICSERVEYPMLMHCKSGADRAGLVSVLICISSRRCRSSRPSASGHPFRAFPAADTGILDFVFERYLRDSARTPMSFLDWVDTV